MTPSSVDSCALGLSEEYLSAWRDGLLPHSELARIREHVPGCGACQARLEELERLGSMLRSQRTPDLRSRVWRDLQAHMSARGSTPTWKITRIHWRSVAAIAATIALVALFGSLFAHRGSISTVGGHSKTATATLGVPLVTPTASAESISAPPGWSAAQGVGRGQAPAIAFSPSSPTTAYAAMVQAGSTVISVSHDGGLTWTQLGTPTTNLNECNLSVDPLDAHDVLLVCQPGASSGFAVLRSFDGGATWTKPRVDVSVNCFQGAGWAGGTPLLSFLLCDAMSSQTQILASFNRGSFVRVDNNGYLGGTQLGPIPLLGGDASAMYVQSGYMQFDSTGGQTVETTLRSTDGGRTWTPVSFYGSGKRIHLLTMTPDGHIFVGEVDGKPTQLAVSSDGGQSWRELPVGPSDVPSFNNVLVAPDGTIAAVSSRFALASNPDPRLFVLQPNAAAWTTLLNLPSNTFPTAFSLDASGHVTALWATYAIDDRGSAWEIISHTWQ